MIRKIAEDSSTWRSDLDILLFFYWNRQHSATGLTPMEAMVGWQPNQLVVETSSPNVPLSAWVAELSSRSARIHDLIDAELSAADFWKDRRNAPIQWVNVSCCYVRIDVRSASRRLKLVGVSSRSCRLQLCGFVEHLKRRQSTWHSLSLTYLMTQPSVCLPTKTVVCLKDVELRELIIYSRCTLRCIIAAKIPAAISGIAPVSGLQKDTSDDFPTYYQVVGC